MDVSLAFQYLCAATQALLDGTAKVEDGVLRLPADTIESNDGWAVRIDSDTEPGFVLYSLVPLPEEPGA